MNRNAEMYDPDMDIESHGGWYGIYLADKELRRITELENPPARTDLDSISWWDFFESTKADSQ
jgi:hypothetical protein